MTLLAEDPVLWDAVFGDPQPQRRFTESLMQRAGPHVLDVGCATGTLCQRLRERGARSVGVDINRRFIAAARAKDPGGEYHEGDMKCFSLKQRFDVLICLGTTFSYNLTHGDVARTLQNFSRHLRPGGILAVDVINAMAMLGPRPFQKLTRHVFDRPGLQATATIRHRLDLSAQLMTEQVDWRLKGQPARHDPAEALRLFFPQELAFHFEVAGFEAVQISDGFERTRQDFSGRRLVIVGTKRGR